MDNIKETIQEMKEQYWKQILITSVVMKALAMVIMYHSCNVDDDYYYKWDRIEIDWSQLVPDHIDQDADMVLHYDEE